VAEVVGVGSGTERLGQGPARRPFGWAGALGHQEQRVAGICLSQHEIARQAQNIAGQTSPPGVPLQKSILAKTNHHRLFY
jgi:hypothetical protein